MRNLKGADGIVTEHDGYRIGHNDALGAFKGGLRFALDVDKDECKVLALWMTIKNAIAGNPFGAAKAAFRSIPPRSLKENENV